MGANTHSYFTELVFKDSDNAPNVSLGNYTNDTEGYTFRDFAGVINYPTLFIRTFRTEHFCEITGTFRFDLFDSLFGNTLTFPLNYEEQPNSTRDKIDRYAITFDGSVSDIPSPEKVNSHSNFDLEYVTITHVKQKCEVCNTIADYVITNGPENTLICENCAKYLQIVHQALYEINSTELAAYTL